MERALWKDCAKLLSKEPYFRARGGITGKALKAWWLAAMTSAWAKWQGHVRASGGSATYNATHQIWEEAHQEYTDWKQHVKSLAAQHEVRP